MRSQLVSVASAFPGADWDLLVRLPGRVVVAATSGERASPSRAVAEGIAGLDAIAAGRASPSKLVQAVVAAIYTERTGLADDDDETDPRSVLASCARATSVLDDRAEAADRQAYREWLGGIAERIRSAGPSGDAPVKKADVAGAAFLDDLSAALRPPR